MLQELADGSDNQGLKKNKSKKKVMMETLRSTILRACVLPAMTYGVETWALTNQTKNKLAAAQTKMERTMLNITYRDRKTNVWIREKTKVTDVIE